MILNDIAERFDTTPEQFSMRRVAPRGMKFCIHGSEGTRINKNLCSFRSVYTSLFSGQVQQESLGLYLERRQRFVESELLTLGFRYGVQTVEQLDRAIERGTFHESEVFEDYFRFDYLESELDSVRELLAQL